MWFRSLNSAKVTGGITLYKPNIFAIKFEYKVMPCDALKMFTSGLKGQSKSIKIKGMSSIRDLSFDFQDLDLKRVKKYNNPANNKRN